MKRKILSALLCVAMTATMLVGCGDKADDTKTDSNNDTQQDSTDDTTTDDTTTDDTTTDDTTTDDTTTDDTAGGEQKLTVWCWDPAFNINAMEKD